MIRAVEVDSVCDLHPGCPRRAGTAPLAERARITRRAKRALRSSEQAVRASGASSRPSGGTRGTESPERSVLGVQLDDELLGELAVDLGAHRELVDEHL